MNVEEFEIAACTVKQCLRRSIKLGELIIPIDSLKKILLLVDISHVDRAKCVFMAHTFPRDQKSV
jgi:hypothetical protein